MRRSRTVLMSVAALAAAMVCGGALARGGCEPEWLNQWWTGSDPEFSVNAIVELPADFPGGGGWVVAGGFSSIGGQPLARIARWDGESWHPLGSGLTGSNVAVSLRVVREGAGWVLIAGGGFSSIGGTAARNVAKWDGASWSALGEGFTGTPGVLALEIFDEGNGPRLFAAGVISNTAITPARNIARWDGTAWTPVGNDVLSFGSVDSMHVHDDGTGPALYIGGEFTSVGSIPGTRGIARWDGANWSSVGGGLTGFFGTVRAMESFSIDGAPDLLVGGLLWEIGGVPAYVMARWNGEAWSSVEGLVGYPDDQFHIEALQTHDDGSGPALFVGGRFQGIEGAQSGSIARWDGEAWHSMGLGVGGTQLWNGDVVALCSSAMDGAPALLLGGYFTTVNGEPQSRLTGWIGCPPSCPADLNGDNLVDFADLNILLGSYNGSGPGLPGDLDGDDDVDFADLNLLLGAYNSVC